MEIVIDKFIIEEKAIDKTYYTNQYEIKANYILKAGDYITMNHWHRGFNINGKILEINKNGIKIDDYLHGIMFVPYTENFEFYKKYINEYAEENQYIDKNRKLIIYPFRLFRNGITDKNFFEEERTVNDFYRKDNVSWISNWNNFKNILGSDRVENVEVLDGQISVFDVLSRKKLNKYKISYSTDSEEYGEEVVEAEDKKKAIQLVADRLKKRGITHFFYKWG